MRQQIEIHPISAEFFEQINRLPNWEATEFGEKCAVESHEHEHDAMYFTKGVKNLRFGEKRLELPNLAAVFIPRGHEHGWSGVKEGSEKAVVGHFHTGHGIHKIVPEY